MNRVPVRARLVVLLAACACAPASETPPQSPAPNLARPAMTATPPDAATEALAAAVAPPSTPTSGGPDAATRDGCAEESETIQIAVTTQQPKGRRGGFVVKASAAPLQLNETLIDTSTLKTQSYTCCVMTEVESIRFECQLPDTSTLGRVYREKDELVVDRGDGRDSTRLPIPCGAWIRFRGPDKACATSP